MVERHHLLLVTLLLGNSLAMEALPIFLDRLVPPYVAILLSVTFVLLFGEIIPQAICTRWGLAIGAYFSWAVWILIVLFFVISYPLSLLLDCILGHEVGTFYRRTEMKALIDMQQKSSDKHSALSYMEAEIIKGAIDLKEKQAKEIMTPKEKVAMLSFDDVLDLEKLQQVISLESLLNLESLKSFHIVHLPKALLTHSWPKIHRFPRLRSWDTAGSRSTTITPTILLECCL